jgi:DegV family protein with EDD domain
MNFVLDGKFFYAGDMPDKEFYDLLRAGKLPTTTAANIEEIRDVMEPCLIDGNDLLYLAFSSGMSVTAGLAETVARQLSEKYPERKVICVDSLCASLGQGLFVFLVNRMRQNGASIDEAAEWALANRLKIAHAVMADDLMHLHRGGRVSKMSAIAGGLIGVKPVIHLNEEGKLIPIDKARGKKKGLTRLVDYLSERVGDGKPDYFMIAHADCEEDAKLLAAMVSERFGINDFMINYIGPVIGTHTGPGALTAFIHIGR